MSDALAVSPRNGTRTIVAGELLRMRPDLKAYASRHAYAPREQPPGEWCLKQAPMVQRTHAHQPEIEVTICHAGREARTLGVLDTGSSITCIPIEWADELGVDLDGAEQISAALASGAVETVISPTPIQIEIAGQLIDLAGPAFVPGLHRLVLGRADIFRRFRVTFDERALLMTLDPYEEDEQCP